MGLLRRRDTLAVTEWLSPDGIEYQTLKAMRFQAQATAGVPSSVGGLPAGETGGTIAAGQPMWEDVAEEDAQLPDPPGGRVLVVALGTAATAASETTNLASGTEMELAGTLTDVEWVPNAAITGQATNYRTITLQQVQVTGTTTPARAITALANVAFSSAAVANAGPGGGVQPGPLPTPLTITTATFSAAAPEELEVASTASGTGLPDPGGILYAVFTRT